MRALFITVMLVSALAIPAGPFVVEADGQQVDAARPAKRAVRVVALGDSITKGTRPGVRPDETFAALAERDLRAAGVDAEVVNQGVGGERTDQALSRLEAVFALQPRVVTVMYGTNDSYVDKGATESRISTEQYKANLEAIVDEMRLRGVLPVLMTAPRWADDAPVNGLGENPNVRLSPFIEACRTVAAERGAPLVDHFSLWTEACSKGQALRDWTTDGCHPNPTGHQRLADAIRPFLVESVRNEAPPVLPKTMSVLESGGPVRVVCFGDSVTGVYYHTGSRRAYPEMLEIGLKRAHPGADVAVINAGVSGNTTRDALARLDRDVLAHDPTLVTVMFGLNDMTRVPIEEYRANLGEIAARCRKAGAEVIFCTPNDVITTPDRPLERLRDYCDVVREEGRRHVVPVCDVQAILASLRLRDPMCWRLLMSDEIHPNMDGHKRVAESLALSIAGKPTDLSDVPPPLPVLPRTGSRLAAGQPVKVLAMPPFDEWVGTAIETKAPGARVEVTQWPTDDRSLADLERFARDQVRATAPDLVLIAVPRSAKADSFEAFVHGQAWVMNASLSFGAGGWDCVVVHPSVVGPDPDPGDGRDALVRRLVKAQDLSLIDRGPDDGRPALEVFRDWFRDKPWRGD